MEPARKTTQYLMPVTRKAEDNIGYDIYPSYVLDDGEIGTDFQSLADRLMKEKVIVIDGYVGVDYESYRTNLDVILQDRGIQVNWVNVSQAMLSESAILDLIEPYMGEPDSIFGTRAQISLADFFDKGKLENLAPDPHASLNVIYGPGAQLAGWEGLLVYIDLPKSATNLGSSQTFDMKTMYKRYYFIDWVVLNKHKKAIVGEIDLIIDGQQFTTCVWMSGNSLRKGLEAMSHTFFRVRPWFEPGVWGGNWMKERIEGLNPDAQNYAWSFELITPENGLIFESAGHLLEVSFDFLMYQSGDAVLGIDRDKFGDEFPLRFDFLDTFDGGNLSVQCHPLPEYCREHFGEKITQEETYYILECKNDAAVYLGFQDDIVPEKFEAALMDSFQSNKELDIEKYVLKHPARKHDLFLIPPGTIHGSGIDNLVLEISTTPYIFTFKLYDWVRPDLDGKPRPLNIGHGMKNLVFDRKGEKAKRELISHPNLTQEGMGWKKYELPTHEKHTYNVDRYHFTDQVKIETKGKFHVLSLVEGTSLSVMSANGRTGTFQYVETFVVPSSAESYTLINHSGKEAMVVVAMMK